MTFIEERHDIMKNAPTEYSVYVLYSEKHNCYVRKTQYWETDKTTTDPTKARLYLKKGAATLSLGFLDSSKDFGDYGFSVYERKVSTAISKVMTPEDKDAKIKSLEAEIERLKKHFMTTLSRSPLNLEELNKILAPPFPHIVYQSKSE